MPSPLTRFIPQSWLLLLVFTSGVNAMVFAQHAGVTLNTGDGIYFLAQHMEFLEDPGQGLDLAAARAPENAARYHPAARGAEVNFGYSRSAYWLRFTVSVLPTAAPDCLLEIAFPSLDQVQVFAPDGNSGYVMQAAGDRRPFAERPYPHRNLVFPLRLAPGATETLYLRVVSEGSLTLPATLWAPEAFHDHDRRSYALLSLYFGMLLALMLYNLLLYLSLRDRVFLAYAY